MQPIQLDETSGVTGVVGWPGGQAGFLADWSHRYVAGESGWMGGKTWAGARKLLTVHIHNAFDCDGRATFVQSVIVGPTYQDILAYDYPHIEAGCEEAGLKCEYKPGIPGIVIKGLGTRSKPSVILVRSAQQPDRISGWEVGAAWGDEASRWPQDFQNPRRDSFIQLLGRIRHPKARFVQGIFTYTNEGDTTRVFSEFHSGKSDFAFYQWSTKDNPLAAEFYAAQATSLTADLKRQYLDGEVVCLRGKRAYDVFDPAVNVQPSLVLQDSLPLHLCLDFNIEPGMHLEIGQYDERADVFTVVHEIHSRRLDLRRAMDEFGNLVARLGGWHWPELHVFGDATGRSEWSGTGESNYQLLKESLENLGVPRYTIRVPKANPMVVDRVNAMNVAFKDLLGRVHWLVHPRCVRLVTDLHDVKTTDEGLIDKANGDLTHASDAEGYRVAYLRPARVRQRQTVGGRFGV